MVDQTETPVVTTWYYYDGQNVWAETDDSDTLLRYYVHGPTYIDERVLMHDAGSILDYFYLLQELYTVAGLADAEGNMVESYDYDGFGRVYVYQAEPSSCDSGADRDCDLEDFGAFQTCFDSSPVCGWADVDTDDDVDLDDYEVLWSCPSPPAVLCSDGDYNGDGFVDGDDQEAFGSCYTGPGVPISPEDEERCGMFDLDCDGDIDYRDYAILLELLYHPVGQPVHLCRLTAADTSLLGNPYFFTGRRLDVIPDLPLGHDPRDTTRQIYHYRRRNYDPFHGRFMQRDPSGYVDGMNLYEYAGSRPTAFADPSGTQLSSVSCPCGSGVGTWDASLNDASMLTPNRRAFGLLSGPPDTLASMLRATFKLTSNCWNNCCIRMGLVQVTCDRSGWTGGFSCQLDQKDGSKPWYSASSVITLGTNKDSVSMQDTPGMSSVKGIEQFFVVCAVCERKNSDEKIALSCIKWGHKFHRNRKAVLGRQKREHWVYSAHRWLPGDYGLGWHAVPTDAAIGDPTFTGTGPNGVTYVTPRVKAYKGPGDPTPDTTWADNNVHYPALFNYFQYADGVSECK